MLNNPFVAALLTGLFAAVGGYLINQLPAIREFPGRNILIFWLTIEVLVLAGVYSWWNATTDKSEAFKVLCLTVGCVNLIFLLRYTSRLIMMLWRTRKGSGSTIQFVDSTTELKIQEWRRQLLKAMNIYVTARLNDSLHNNEIIRLQVENSQERVNRPIKPQIINNPSLLKLLLKRLGVSDSQLESGKPIIEIFQKRIFIHLI